MKKYFNVATNSKGEYLTRMKGNKSNTYAYSKWHGMIIRCYDTKFHKKKPHYKNCTVCDEWLEFQTFAKWYYENCPNHSYSLDKDLLVKGNKHYSPETVCFLPIAISNLFEGSMKGYSLSSYIPKKGNRKYRAWYNEGKKQIHLGLYDTPKEAHDVYVIAKEKWIKKVARNYKNVISDKVYSAMINYKVGD